jgi:hypothetical protein
VAVSTAGRNVGGGATTLRVLWSRFGGLCVGSGESVAHLSPDILNTQSYAYGSLLCVRYTAAASILACMIPECEMRSGGEISKK